MHEKIIFFLTIASLLYFGFVLYLYGTPKAYLLGILYLLPFMNFLATKSNMGGFKVFDIVTFGSGFYLIRYFLIDNIIDKKYLHLLMFIILMGIAITGSIISEHPGVSLVDTLKILPVFIYARFLVLECIQDEKFHYKIIKTLKTILGIAAVFLLIQLVVGIKFTFYSSLNINTFDPLRGAIRYPGYFNDSQVQGQFFAAGMLLFLYNPSGVTKRERWMNYFFFCIAFIAVYVSGSRSAFLGMAIGLFIALILIGRKYIIYLVILGAIAFPVITDYPNKSGVMSRSKDSSEDLKFRQSIWSEAYKIALKHPMLGIGSGNYLEYTMKHNPGQYFELENNEIMYFDQPENGYLKILVEFGFIGFIAFLIIIISPIFSSLALFFQNEVSPQIIIIIASLFTWIVAFNTVYSLLDTRMLIMIATLIVLLLTFPKTAKHSELN